MFKGWWIKLVIVGMVLLVKPATVMAEDPKVLVPLPSVVDYTDGSGWGVALGLGVEYETAYDGSDEREFELDPAGAVQWRRGDQLLFWEGIELGWRGLLTDQWLGQVNLRYEGGREADDSDDDRLDGLDEVDSTVVGVIETRYRLNPDWKSWVGGRVMAGDSDFGLLGVLAVGYRFGAATDGTGAEVIGFTTLGNSDFLNRDFGVTARESLRSGLAETDLDAGYRSVGVTLIDRRRIAEHWQIVTELGVEWYGSEVRSSPIAREDFEWEVGLSLLYVF